MLILKIWVCIWFCQHLLTGTRTSVFELLKSLTRVVFFVYFWNTTNIVFLSTGFQVL